MFGTSGTDNGRETNLREFSRTPVQRERERESEMRRNNMRKFDLQEFTFGLLLIGQREKFRLRETGPR